MAIHGYRNKHGYRNLSHGFFHMGPTILEERFLTKYWNVFMENQRNTEAINMSKSKSGERMSTTPTVSNKSDEHDEEDQPQERNIISQEENGGISKNLRTCLSYFLFVWDKTPQNRMRFVLFATIKTR